MAVRHWSPTGIKVHVSEDCAEYFRQYRALGRVKTRREMFEAWKQSEEQKAREAQKEN